MKNEKIRTSICLYHLLVTALIFVINSRTSLWFVTQSLSSVREGFGLCDDLYEHRGLPISNVNIQVLCTCHYILLIILD